MNKAINFFKFFFIGMGVVYLYYSFGTFLINVYKKSSKVQKIIIIIFLFITAIAIINNYNNE